MVGRAQLLPEVHRRPGHRRRVPPRHRLGAGRPAHGTTRAADRRLPQHHAGPVLRRVGSADPPRRSSGDAASSPRSRRDAASGWRTRSSTAPSSRRAATGRPRSCRSSSTSKRSTATSTRSSSRACRRPRDAGGADWLFVGRVTPNKCQHDVVKAFAAYRRLHDPQARLHLVGGVASSPTRRLCARSCAASSSTDCVDLTGPVSAGGLAAYYRNADVFVCLSEHEGFCVPLLESMHHHVPVVAFAATAVPETLDGAGICLPDKAPAVVAAGGASCRHRRRAARQAARRRRATPR